MFKDGRTKSLKKFDFTAFGQNQDLHAKKLM